MITFVIALCNVAIGTLLAVVAALIAPLFFSGYASFGIVLSLLSIVIVALVFLLDWFDGRIKNFLLGWIGIPKEIERSNSNTGIRTVHWGAFGFCLGLAASVVWTPRAVLDVFSTLVN